MRKAHPAPAPRRVGRFRLQNRPSSPDAVSCSTFGVDGRPPQARRGGSSCRGWPGRRRCCRAPAERRSCCRRGRPGRRRHGRGSVRLRSCRRSRGPAARCSGRRRRVPTGRRRHGRGSAPRWFPGRARTRRRFPGRGWTIGALVASGPEWRPRFPLLRPGGQGNLLRGQLARLGGRRSQRELQDVTPAGQLLRIDAGALQLAAVHERRRVRRVVASGVGNPQRARERAQVADEAESLDRVVPVAQAADPRTFLSPGGSPRLPRQQARNQESGEEQVRLPPRLARDVVERDHLDAAAHVLQCSRDLDKVPVACREQHAVDVAGFQKYVDSHVQVAVGLAEPLAVFVDVPLDVLDDHLVAEVAQRRLKAPHVAPVVLVGLRSFAVERRVRIQPHRVRSIAAGELPEHVVAQPPPAVPGDVVRIDVDTDSHALLPFRCRAAVRPYVQYKARRREPTPHLHDAARSPRSHRSRCPAKTGFLGCPTTLHGISSPNAAAGVIHRSSRHRSPRRRRNATARRGCRGRAVGRDPYGRRGRPGRR